MAEAPYVVCCDGGADEYIRRGNVPDVIIGDGDSLSDENRRKFGHILHRISDQETNDQTKAVNFLLAQGKRRIAIIGATGKREDHTLGNISLLIDYLRAGADVRTYTDYGIFIPAGVPAPSQAIPDSKYPSSTSLHTVCMAKNWSIPSATSPTGGKAHSTNAPVRNSPSSGRGIPGIRHYFFASATSTKYTLIQIMAMAAACVQLKRSCPKVRETTVVTTNIR